MASSVEANSPKGLPAKFGDLDRARLDNADSEPWNWFTVGRDAGKGHYSPLTQINKENVKNLGLAWEYETFTNRGLEATPIVIDGVMYTSGTTGRVYALDAATGEEIWYFDPEADRQYNRFNCCDEVNRGVAVWKGKVYVGSLDGYLIALDAKTGDVVWKADTLEGNRDRTYNITGAPEIAGNTVVIGNGGAEFDARGFFSAYDLETGEFKWRFYTVPRDPKLGQEHEELEMAVETWDPNSRWEIGGGGTAWTGMIYDPEVNLLYVATGNANSYPWKERSPSGGANLFTASIIAVNPDTGRMAWYYQQVPGDEWDFDANQPLMIGDVEIDGEKRRVLMQAPKDGFFYVWDRATGEVLRAHNYAPVNWATHVDLETGQPVIDVEQARYSETEPKFVYPTNMGAHNWHAMALDPTNGLVYIPVIEATMIIQDAPGELVYEKRRTNTGTVSMFGDMLMTTEDKIPPQFRDLFRKAKDNGEILSRVMIRAFDPVTGETAWEREGASVYDRSGLLATGGGLVFRGTDTGYFQAYDKATGEMLLNIHVGTSIMAAPMSYMVDGVQYVSVMAAFGGGGWSFPHPTSALRKYGNEGRILTFKLDGGPVRVPPEKPAPGPIPKPPVTTDASPAIIAKGASLYGNCGMCHSNDPEVDTIPDLRRMTAATHAEFNDIVLGGARVDRAMPRWDDVLNEDDANALHAFLIDMAWNAYNAQEAGAAQEDEMVQPGKTAQ
jgi:quinohemoprotein ethanol dehydrogenase